MKVDPEFTYCEDLSPWDLYTSDAEDKSISERRVLISCDAGRKEWNTVMGPLKNPNPRGSLWSYSPVSGKTTRLVLQDFPEDHTFHPLGLEACPSYAGNSSYLYVVNHAKEKTVIEQFLISPSFAVAKHIRTLSHPLFISPNAIALTGPNSFYVTNDHVFTRRLPYYIGSVLPIVETVFGLPLSFTAHVTLDANEAESDNPILEHTIVAPFVAFSNGISISPSGLEVAIASTSIAQVHFYSRNITSNALTYTSSVHLPFSADNVNYDENGNLVVSGHPHFPTLIKLAANKTDVAPSWVISISPLEGETKPEPEYDLKATLSASAMVPPPARHTLETLFQSNGSKFSTGCTGLNDPISGNLYVSGLYAEEGVIVCHP